MLDGLDPETHPINRRYTMPTPAIQAAYDALIDVIKERNAGLIIPGDYRGGKTWFCDYVMKALKDDFGDQLAYFFLTCVHHKRSPPESRHLSWMLGELGYVPTARDPYDKKKQMDDYLAQEGQKAKRRQVVILIDEAQKLHIDQWGWFIDTYNRIEKKEVVPTFVWVGEPGLKGVRNTMLKSKQHQIVNRFLVCQQELMGPGSADELTLWLEPFDYRSEYPAGSKISYTEFFFTTAFREGWRLQHIAADLWREIGRAFEAANEPVPETIRTKYFFKIVENVLFKFGNRLVVVPDMSPEVLQAAIAASRYVEAVQAGFLREDEA